MNNLPVKGSDERICGTIKGDGIIHIVNSNGYIIDRVHFNPDYLEGLATTIAMLITEARDQGFKQGQAHVRAALGL